MKERLIRSWSIVLCIALGSMFAPPATRAAPAPDPALAPLLQFTAGGHVIGFQPTQVVIAALDHALRVEFVGTAGVMPVAAVADASAPSGGGTTGQAQPLGVVTYPDVWRGVSIEYRASEGNILKSTYIVAPGADTTQIRLRYNVPVELQSDGSLRFPFGRGYVGESAPIAWQEIDGARMLVPVAFAMLPSPDRRGAGGEVGFRLGAYDPRYPLTIDPNYLWHTFYGSGSDAGRGIAVDGSGNVYVTGASYNSWLGDGGQSPLHAHSGSGNWDIYVVKLNSSGAHQWHTFYGSGVSDDSYGIVADGNGSIYVTGMSDASWQGDSGQNPLHALSGWRDIFVLKLNSSGAYQWHTFYGSASQDYGHGIAADGSGNVYMTGDSDATWQGDGGANPLHPYNYWTDIFVLKLNSSGVYQWHTFYGSASHDYGRGIAVYGSGNVYVTGRSDASWQGDIGQSPLHSHSGGGDMVVLKLNSSGAYQWHTFYGSGGTDYGRGIAVDGSGNVYVTGDSNTTWQGDGGANPLHAHSGGFEDIVVLELNSSGAYQWHTFYGSSAADKGYGIAVDGSDNVYVTVCSAATWQGDGDANPLHPYYWGNDIVVLKLNNSGAYQWHTFYGSNLEDNGYGSAVDGSGNVYVTGQSAATWQGDGGSNPLHPYGVGSIVVLKLRGTLDTTTTITADTPDPSVVGQSVTVSFTVTATLGTPTGVVTVTDGLDSCTATVAAGACVLTPTMAGAITLTATYAGDANFDSSSDSEPHTVTLWYLYLPLILRQSP
jgi:hypothetical protein